MKYRTQILTMVGLLALSAISVPDAAPESDAEPALVRRGSLEQHQIHGGTARERAAVRYGIFLFAREGLYMPRLDIYIHDEYSGCMGHGGVFNQDGSGLRIDLCDDVLLHELAHAWEYHNVSDEVQLAFWAHTGLPTWDDHSYEPGERAIEAAADAIAYGIEPGKLTGEQVVGKREWLYRYELLVGKPSPRLAQRVVPGSTEPGTTALPVAIPHDPTSSNLVPD